MPQPLFPQGKIPWYPLDRNLGGPQRQSGHSVKEKNSQPLPGIKPRSSNHPACSQSLYQLSYPGPFVVYRTEQTVLCHKSKKGSGRRLVHMFKCWLFIYSHCLTRAGACAVDSLAAWDGVGDEGGVGKREGMILRLWSQLRLVSSTSLLLLFLSSTLLLLLSSLLLHSNGDCSHLAGVIIVTSMLSLWHKYNIIFIYL
jgi:hypothetical protein